MRALVGTSRWGDNMKVRGLSGDRWQGKRGVMIQTEGGRPEMRKGSCHCVKLEWCRVMEREEGRVLREQEDQEEESWSVILS